MKKKILGIIIGVLLAASVAVLPVGAWTATNLQWLSYDGDGWYNYDFVNWDLESDDVDWPITVLYYGDASVSYLKGIIWGEASSDSDMRLLVYDSGSYTYDIDKGSKSGWPNGKHVRLYADDGDASHSSSLGAYVLGSTHTDEWITGAGWSEWTAGEVASKVAETVGWNNIAQDWVNMYNYERYRVEDFYKFIDNDGKADFVYIP